jgi:hypothetical protein
MSELYNGQDWATHSVSLLLCNTFNLYGTARELAQEDASGASLGEWVGEWFWGDLRALDATDKGAVEGTRNDISRNDFNRIDWKSVAEDLAAE